MQTAKPEDVGFSQERLRRYFVKEHGGYRARRELRECVLFAVHDLLKDPPFSRMDLISCRNLLIYLTREAQKRALLEQGMTEWLVKALLDLQQFYRNGKGGDTDGLLEKLLERAPITMDEFLNENAQEFRPQATQA